MHQLIHRVDRNIRERKLLTQGDKVVVAISGGADSTALLHILFSLKLDLQLIAVYIDHGLRPAETGNELARVKQYAKDLDITFESREIAVTKYKEQHKSSTEEAARILRYRALEDICKSRKAKTIAVAHTADDQVEEFFIRMIRGSGLKGLCGMEYRRDTIIRPLLAETKESLLSYLHDHNLDYCHDSSNDDRSFLRNRVRLELLPHLEKLYNPAIRNTILQTTSILQQEENLLESLTNDLMEQLTTVPPGSDEAIPSHTGLSRQKIINCHPALQRRLLEKICWRMNSRPTFRQLLQLQELVCSGTSGARLHLAHGLRVQIDAEDVYFSHPVGRTKVRGDLKKVMTLEECLISGPGVFHFPAIEKTLQVQQLNCVELNELSPETLVVDACSAAFPLRVRSAEPGERMYPLGAPGTKKISRIYNDLKIPSEQRVRYPLILCSGGIVAILGLRIANPFRVTKDSSLLLTLKWENNSTSTLG